MKRRPDFRRQRKVLPDQTHYNPDDHSLCDPPSAEPRSQSQNLVHGLPSAQTEALSGASIEIEAPPSPQATSGPESEKPRRSGRVRRENSAYKNYLCCDHIHVTTGKSVAQSSKRKIENENPMSKEFLKKAEIDKDLAECLVGLRIKVWWPLDKMFYEGLIVSFDPVEQKHKVVYVDGDVETLNLQSEHWVPVDGVQVDGKPLEECSPAHLGSSRGPCTDGSEQPISPPGPSMQQIKGTVSDEVVKYTMMGSRGLPVQIMSPLQSDRTRDISVSHISQMSMDELWLQYAISRQREEAMKQSFYEKSSEYYQYLRQVQQERDAEQQKRVALEEEVERLKKQMRESDSFVESMADTFLCRLKKRKQDAGDALGSGN